MDVAIVDLFSANPAVSVEKQINFAHFFFFFK